MEPFDNNDRHSGILLDIAVAEVIKDSRKFIRVTFFHRSGAQANSVYQALLSYRPERNEGATTGLRILLRRWIPLVSVFNLFRTQQQSLTTSAMLNTKN